MMYERRIENSMLKIMRELERLQLMRKVEEADVADEQSPMQIRSTRNRKGDLKKQSQFAPALMGTKPSIRKDYDDKPHCGVTENKAKQSQFKDRPEGAGRRKGSRQALSGSEVAG